MPGQDEQGGCRRGSTWRWGVGLALAVLPVSSFAPNWPEGVTWGGYAAAEYRQFLQSPLESRQGRQQASAALQPEFTYTWGEDRRRLTLIPFGRLDSLDPRRTHFDLREANLLWMGDAWDFRLGISKAFWGVTESVHLVDIINQTDLVENISGEEKLGQPMLNLNLSQPWGRLEWFVLPGFRERTFPGSAARLRTVPRILADRAEYESGAREWHPGAAARWSRTFGPADLGLSYFYGTSREPSYLPMIEGSELVLVPYYEIIHQPALDLQVVTGNWLWKLESIVRSGQGSAFAGAVGGFEYTFHALAGTAADLGLLAEFLYDSRGRTFLNPFDRAVFAGVRLAPNDLAGTELLAGAIVDTRDRFSVVSLEARRRFGTRFVGKLEGRAFNHIPRESHALSGFRRDDYLQIALEYHF